MRCRKSAKPRIIHQLCLRIPLRCISACSSGTPQRKWKIPEGYLARREICENLRSILREFEPVTYISTSRSRKRYSALREQSASQASLHLFRCHILRLHRIAASADDRVLRSRKSSQLSPFPTWFMTHDPPRKKSH